MRAEMVPPFLTRMTSDAAEDHVRLTSVMVRINLGYTCMYVGDNRPDAKFHRGVAGQ